MLSLSSGSDLTQCDYYYEYEANLRVNASRTHKRMCSLFPVQTKITDQQFPFCLVRLLCDKLLEYSNLYVQFI